MNYFEGRKIIMMFGVIGEGETEYNCVPSMIATLGHTVAGVHNLGGVGPDYPWDRVFTDKIYPYVRGFAVKRPENRPDRVLIVLDRESREDCCGNLASAAEELLSQSLAKDNLTISLSVVLANRQFECWLLANIHVLDKSRIMKRPISELLNGGTDERNVLRIITSNLVRGETWDKPRYGKQLAQRLDLQDASVLANSRSLRKFVKEVTK